MRVLQGIFLMIVIFLSSCSVDKFSPTIRFPYLWLDEQGFGGDIDRQEFPEPSGICFHPLRETLFVVSDEGEITEIETDGTPVSRTTIPGDLEGVAVDPETGLLYVIIEGDDVILEFDPDKSELLRSFPLNRTYQGNPNYIEKKADRYDNGIESIEFVKDEKHPEGGTFYIGNQWDPPCVMEVLIPLKTSREKTAEAHILRVLPLDINDPAALFYDTKTGLLNVVNDADNILVEITLDGRIVREYAFLGDEQEGIARDDEGYLYIAQDRGGILKVKDLR
jgi:uncharacterized protein YjiK